MRKRWYYLYVIVYPSLGYRFYYGSRITDRHPDDDINYFGSSRTFAHYNDPTHAEYQADALKVILWASRQTTAKKHAVALGKLETDYIRRALEDSEHLGPEACLNRNYAGRIVLTPAEQQLALERSRAGGSGFVNMTPEKHREVASSGGKKSYELRTGVHGVPEEKLAEARARGRETIAQKYAKQYTFLSPYDKVITFTNMKEFCRLHKLHAGHMRRVHSGKLKSHKGWRKPETPW